jgi:ABC-type bacteriocin/lantibiotic exporter with double-glycine peptidase domain
VPTPPSKLSLILGVIGRRRFYMALMLLIGAALLEVAVAGLFFPYLDMLLNPDNVQDHVAWAFIIDSLGLTSTDQLLRWFGGLLIIVVIVSGLAGGLSKVFTTRYIWNAYVTLTRRLYRIYLDKPYIQWRSENSDALAKNVIGEVSTFTNGLLVPVIDFLARATVLVVWTALLIAIDPLVALLGISVMGGIYLAIFGALRRRLTGMSEQRFQMQEELFAFVSSSFRNVKDIKLSQAEAIFTRKVEEPARLYSTLNTRIGIMTQLPRYGIEALVFLVAVLILLSFVGTAQLTEVIPVLSIYTLAGFRMLPHMQNLFASSAKIKYNLKALDVVADQLRLERAIGRPAQQGNIEPFRSLRAAKLTFRFPGANRYVFTNADFEIHAGEVVFIQGKSGSGKSTLGELLLGLLPPTAGRISCNDTPLDAGTVLTHRINAGYVSQESALFGGALIDNISLYRDPLGADTGLGKRKHLSRVIAAACAEDIVDALEEGVDGWVMEGGKNLSAGQRQRVGLARALYQNPDLLILDEATNALDPATEKRVIANIRGLGIAVVIITHQTELLLPGDVAYDFEPYEELPDDRSEAVGVEITSHIQRRAATGA